MPKKVKQEKTESVDHDVKEILSLVEVLKNEKRIEEMIKQVFKECFDECLIELKEINKQKPKKSKKEKVILPKESESIRIVFD